ncbi:NAD(P)/FAD-dependent oxidoreductase [Flavobacterium capsici]|uniref:FAD-dependent oxidoreductase n=1 Tax=Flavobacterium capsici TaxID=3075618 RepID=A0AA96EV53_9FLAO|nr:MULTISPECIES: FAD-dependent oxidoreductase [unclassified Flavobacterium]WNM19143.1 FAD-dependent oxidoreductase [Flavobacterium sp. PMR2A8]WNM20532.1 FAD-dependent oxidoreductase [Flavobacterium sp. PMTSA4]
MIDYIIVGSGLSGIAFAETLLQNDKSFVVFDDDSQNSSRIAGGLYNPVILKRFSEVWNAKEQLNIAIPFYKKIEDKLSITIDYKLPIYRKFFSVEEQNNWFIAADKPNLSPFLSTSIVKKDYNSINSPFGYGEVLQTGYVDTVELLYSYHKYLKANNLLISETFDYSKINFSDDFIKYNNLEAKHIVFAEGFGMHSNPFFDYLPLDGTKGELFIIKAPELDLDVIINTSVFILPLGNHLFKVGATYDWKDKTNNPTEEGKQELLERIREIISCDFEILEHYAGIRPTVNDRRPLLGTHPEFKNLHILNGLGTRGVMLAPAMAIDLYNYIENKISLDKTIDINRYARFL